MSTDIYHSYNSLNFSLMVNGSAGSNTACKFQFVATLALHEWHTFKRSFGNVTGEAKPIKPL